MGSVTTALLLVVAAAFTIDTIAGHGMMLDPINRSSLWRKDPTAPHNYNDNENFCGGFGANHGKCGVCGDNFADPIPRKNENTGLYGNGKIVATYKSGSVIPVNINLTANHKGDFSYSLCVLKDASKPETDNCFRPLLLKDGSKKFLIDSSRAFVNHVRLPAGLKCKRCVLRWTYRTGNSWGTCSDGDGTLGCGEQEKFRSCSDISIV